MSVFLNPPLCANTERRVYGHILPCHKKASLACSGCFLVQYCSKECQDADRPRHEMTCNSDIMKGTWIPSWVKNKEPPAFFGDGGPLAAFGEHKYLWGNMPALDLLNIQENEGPQDLNRDYALLLAASGDLRHVVKSIIGLPNGYKGECTLVLNDREFLVTARNVILVLAALHFPPETAVPVMIHLWYSSLLPSVMVRALQTEVLPYVEEVCTKIKDKASGVLQAKTFTIHGRDLRVVLEKEEWFRLAKLFQVPDCLSGHAAEAIRHKIMMAPQRVHYVDRAMLHYPRPLHESEMRFRRRGILLPFGCATGEFNTPNPTFFQDSYWPMPDSLTPRDGWAHADYIKHAPAAKADDYACLFFFLRDTLLKFCGRLRDAKIKFLFFKQDARMLPKYLENMKFDRIEMANLCDRGYVGPKSCISLFSPLVKSKAENPKATLLMLFLNTVPEEYGAQPMKAKLEGIEDRMLHLAHYLPTTHFLNAEIRKGDENHPALIRRTQCLDMFLDFDKLFEVVLKDIDSVARTSGMRIKSKHSIAEQWPYRIKASTTKEDFDVICASSVTGHERYVELEKTE